MSFKEDSFRLTDELSFWERAYNFLAYLRELYIHQHIVLRRVDKLFQVNLGITTFDLSYRNIFLAEYRIHSLWSAMLPSILSTIRQSLILHGPIVMQNLFILFKLTIFNFQVPRVNFVGGLHCKNQSKWSADKASCCIFFNFIFFSEITRICEFFYSRAWLHFDYKRFLTTMGGCSTRSHCKFNYKATYSNF